MSQYQGPLSGVRVVEFAGIGPGPFSGMLLAQLGADVLRIDRAVADKGGSADLLPIPEKFDLMNRGKARRAFDLKDPAAIEEVLQIVEKADLLIEGFRPGVMERLGLGPEPCLARNPALVYGRVTGWGQTGPLAQDAGHDITYIAPTGVLAAIGEAGGPPVPPLNLIGDFAGGALYLVIGLLAALQQARSTGHGQVIDAAMMDGATHLMTFQYGLRQCGFWGLERGSNQPDGGFPFNAVYQCSDGNFIAVAAAEMKFRMTLLDRLGVDPEVGKAAEKPKNWPTVKAQLADIFLTDTRDNWIKRLEGRETCVSPVLNMDEAPDHPQMQARAVFTRQDGVLAPALAPKFSDGVPAPAAKDAAQMLNDWSRKA